MTDRRILLIEPYFGGSHKQFLEGLMHHVPARYTLLHLPARKWKMRMQLSAPWFAGQIAEMEPERRGFDRVVCSTFVDVAVLRALLCTLAGWNHECRFLTYFHENQFHYPGLLPKETCRQFTAINFTTALVSDAVAFNSEYNRATFLAQCRKYTAKAADMDVCRDVDAIEAKSVVLHPGLDFDGIDGQKRVASRERTPLVIWNHRWEHDKNPEEFFEALYRLQEKKIPFRLAVLGQSFRHQPPCFAEARDRLADRISHFGYLKKRSDYYRLLVQGNVVVSTALHEFFGLAILEAVRAGCVPVLPRRLAYPEIFGDRYLYRPGQLFSCLKQLLLSRPQLSAGQRIRMTERFSWAFLSDAYRAWLGV